MASLVCDALLAVGIGVVSRFVGRFLALSPGFRVFFVWQFDPSLSSLCHRYDIEQENCRARVLSRVFHFVLRRFLWGRAVKGVSIVQVSLVMVMGQGNFVRDVLTLCCGFDDLTTSLNGMRVGSFE